MLAKTFYGTSASEGIAIGPAFLYQKRVFTVEKQEVENSHSELVRLEAALQQATQELRHLATQAQAAIGASEAEIFEAQALFLEDPELLRNVHRHIESQGVNVEYAWSQETAHYITNLRAIGDAYLSARADDVEDVAQRLLGVLQGYEAELLLPTEPVVVVARELGPADTVMFDKTKVLAFCVATGGPTSHAAILARALGIPAVVSLGDEIDQLTRGTQVIVDGASGELLVEPDSATVADYHRRAELLAALRQEALKSIDQPAVTLDGTRVEIVANIGSAEDAQEALQYGAEGTGLLRTEFLFLEGETAPDEEQQEKMYRTILEIMGTRPVVVRTLDIGGDKPAPYLNQISEMNPFLGVRGIRLALAHPALFQEQLRALLRAATGRNLKILLPMVATIEEITAVRTQLEQVQSALEGEQRAYAKNVAMGIMIEVPSAALMADVLAEEVDFFSIGTNDLAQYTLASDRTNGSVSKLADALHPSVLRLIRLVIEAAHARGKWVGLCGELAGNPLAVPVLLGLGLDEFSMVPKAIPVLKQSIRRWKITDARGIAEHVLALRNAVEVRAYLESVVR